MFGLIKKIFLGLLTSTVNGSIDTKCMLLRNWRCMIQPTLINLYPNGYSQELHYYPHAVKVDRCVRSFNTFNELSNKVCVPSKSEDINIYVFNMITEKNESNILTKHLSCKCKYKFDGSQIKSGIMINVDDSVKDIIYVIKIIFGILLHAVAKMVNI